MQGKPAAIERCKIQPTFTKVTNVEDKNNDQKKGNLFTANLFDRCKDQRSRRVRIPNAETTRHSSCRVD